MVSSEISSAALVEPLAELPQSAALASLVRACALDATLARRADFGSRPRSGAGPIAGPGHIPEELTREDTETPFGNVLDVLERGAERPEERALLGALLAIAIRNDPPGDLAAEAELAGHLVWLAAHTPCDALSALDVALTSDAADGLWSAVAAVTTATMGLPLDFGRTEALVAAAALRDSPSPMARALRFDAATTAPDPTVRALLSVGAGELTGELVGEVQPAPRPLALTLVLALTLLLFVLGALRLIGRYVFAYRRPAALRLGPNGLQLSQRIELMGRVLRDRSTVVPLSNLARITREVRYARVGLYAGLIALTLGTYFGTGLLVDGIRVPGGSAPLIGLAVLLIVLGLATDFLLSSLAESARGRCRVVVAQRRGRTLCVGGLDPRQADTLLAAVAEHSRATPEAAAEAPSEAAAPA
ncbi:MAG TPA: hypothetical protein VER33_25760 [Polyangiaceae bacterium]|nr:hypothetical protein [Polyangiaceae bacterium]